MHRLGEKINFLIENDIFSGRYYSFRSGWSCITNLALFRDNLTVYYKNDLILDACFFSLAKAFDRILHILFSQNLDS